MSQVGQGWTRHMSRSQNRPYLYHQQRNERVWTEEGLPRGWAFVWEGQAKTYVNVLTKEKSKKRPRGSEGTKGDGAGDGGSASSSSSSSSSSTSLSVSSSSAIAVPSSVNLKTTALGAAATSTAVPTAADMGADKKHAKRAEGDTCPENCVSR